MVNEDGSLKLRSVAAAAGAGEGVAGGFAVAEPKAGTGAAGAAGVCVVSRAGVDGAALLAEATGAAFGCAELVNCWWRIQSTTNL